MPVRSSPIAELAHPSQFLIFNLWFDLFSFLVSCIINTVTIPCSNPRAHHLCLADYFLSFQYWYFGTKKFKLQASIYSFKIVSVLGLALRLSIFFNQKNLFHYHHLYNLFHRHHIYALVCTLEISALTSYAIYYITGVMTSQNNLLTITVMLSGHLNCSLVQLLKRLVQS